MGMGVYACVKARRCTNTAYTAHTAKTANATWMRGTGSRGAGRRVPAREQSFDVW
jgi:hypothetical protein